MAKSELTRQSRKINTSVTLRRARPKPRWQERLLPTMIGLLIGLTVFFFLTTFAQMAYLHWSILQSPPVNINQTAGNDLMESAQTFDDRLKARELDVKSRMEVFIITQRYHQASVLLMSGLWVRYLGFVTGMILALVGASFVLGKLREPTQKLEGNFQGVGLSLRTASPGVILAVLGVLLMFATILDKDSYSVNDSNTYLYSIQSTDTLGGLSGPTLIPPGQVYGTPTSIP